MFNINSFKDGGCSCTASKHSSTRLNFCLNDKELLALKSVKPSQLTPHIHTHTLHFYQCSYTAWFYTHKLSLTHNSYSTHTHTHSVHTDITQNLLTCIFAGDRRWQRWYVVLWVRDIFCVSAAFNTSISENTCRSLWVYCFTVKKL